MTTARAFPSFRMMVAGVAGMMALSGAASAQIFVPNHDFENPVLPANSFTTAGSGGVPGWTRISLGDFGVFHPTVGQWGYAAPGGNNLLYSNGAVVECVLAENLQAGVTYTLSVDLILRPGFGSQNYLIALYAGSGLLVQEAAAVTLTPTQVSTRVLTFTASANDPLVGQPLAIRLGGPGTQTNFDNVRLVPTPGAAVLACVAGLVVARRRR